MWKTKQCQESKWHEEQIDPRKGFLKGKRRGAVSIHKLKEKKNKELKLPMTGAMQRFVMVRLNFS
jgi:hypothetical protein